MLFVLRFARAIADFHLGHPQHRLACFLPMPLPSTMLLILLLARAIADPHIAEHLCTRVSSCSSFSSSSSSCYYSAFSSSSSSCFSSSSFTLNVSSLRTVVHHIAHCLTRRNRSHASQLSSGGATSFSRGRNRSTTRVWRCLPASPCFTLLFPALIMVFIIFAATTLSISSYVCTAANAEFHVGHRGCHGLLVHTRATADPPPPHPPPYLFPHLECFLLSTRVSSCFSSSSSSSGVLQQGGLGDSPISKSMGRTCLEKARPGEPGP